ncbi:MAG: hypothetical protein EOP07_07785 [Proteobacteria bacterium]|nr:MAG: hypothetical protein EOP07_07785 [Pseudomonadota bacterium]
MRKITLHYKYKTLILSFALFASGAAYSHARLKPGSATPPRNDSTGLKTPECGGVARTLTPKVYKPGQEITVEWEETINHPGYFILQFSEAGDTNFEAHTLVAKYADTKNDPISLPTEYHQYSTKIKLPNLTCAACTLQLIQVMEEDPLKPSRYYSCSDIVLSDSKVPDPLVPTTPTSPTTGKPTKPAKPGTVKVEKTK